MNTALKVLIPFCIVSAGILAGFPIGDVLGVHVGQLGVSAWRIGLYIGYFIGIGMVVDRALSIKWSSNEKVTSESRPQPDTESETSIPYRGGGYLG